MKFRLFSILAAASALVLTACGNSGNNIALAVGSPDIDIHTDWAAYGLLGPVESVTYIYDDYNSTMNFSFKGKEQNGIFEKSRFKGRVRSVETSHMTCISFTFDELGRVVSENASDYNTQYEYEGDAYYPKKSVSEYWEIGDEEATKSEVVYEYKASDFDSHGNWLVRKENGKKQKRVITYHVDPYDLGPAPHYTSAVELVNAILKAEKNLDAKALLLTCEYKMRKKYEITVESQQKGMDRRKELLGEITSFQVYDEVAKGQRGNYKVTADVYFDKSAPEEYTFLVYQGEDGYWYNSLLSVGKRKKK